MCLQVMYGSDDSFTGFLENSTVSKYHSHYTFRAILVVQKKLYRDAFSTSKMSCLIFIILQNSNHFCFDINLGDCCYVLSFWHKGPIRGKRCIQINVPNKPSSESWERSHLCWPHDGIYKFKWLTQRPSYEERDSCLEWTEPRDPTWKAKTYYLCATKVQQAIGMCGLYVKIVQNT